MALSIALSGCAEATNDVTAVATESATPAAFNVTGAPMIEFSVPDMMCEEGCGAATREILAEQAGVKEVKIDFPSKLAVVAVDQEKFNVDKALAELIDHGFDKSTLKASAAQ
ncbi:MAG: heavy-metal-associated domain-containing protein [Pirellulales bacterium]